MVKKRLPDWLVEEAFAQSWRTPMAQWIGQELIFKKKPQIDFYQEILNCPNMFFTVFSRIDSQFS